jgi:hypothetical protein
MERLNDLQQELDGDWAAAYDALDAEYNPLEFQPSNSDASDDEA